MSKLSAEAKVGLLVLGSSVILLWMTMMVGKFDFGKPKGYTVTATFDTVSGLDLKASVRMAGVQIGTVEAVELDDSKAKVILRIDPKVRIPKGAEAAVKTMGLLGDKYVDLIPPQHQAIPGQTGPERSGFYKEGDRLERTVPSSDADQLIAKLSAIADDIKKVTNSMSNVFGSQRGERSMEDILHDLRETTANIKEFSYALNSDGSELIVRLNDLARNLNGVVNDNKDNLKTTLENVKEASKNAELALASIENVTKRIDRGEGTLGKLVTDEGMYNNIDSAAKGISDYVSRVERMRTTVSFRDEYPGTQAQDGPVLHPRGPDRSLREVRPHRDRAERRHHGHGDLQGQAQVQHRVRQTLGQPRYPHGHHGVRGRRGSGLVRLRRPGEVQRRFLELQQQGAAQRTGPHEGHGDLGHQQALFPERRHGQHPQRRPAGGIPRRGPAVRRRRHEVSHGQRADPEVRNARLTLRS
jgi:virulence factor Mce-like protein